MARHFLSLHDVSREELLGLIDAAQKIKAEWKAGQLNHQLSGKVLGMIFEKASTRTRVSFEAGMAQLGGSAIFLSPNDTQLGRGEPIEDSARVISSMVDIVMIRTFEQAKLEQFAANSSVPVINALTDSFHPCQLLADIQTFVELRGNMQGAKVAWVGDGNNMCHSYINAAGILDFQLTIACPEGYDPDPQIAARYPNNVSFTRVPADAIKGADLVVTDTWASMGQESEKQARLEAFAGYQINEKVMESAADDALFMHCLPAYRGMEISDTMLDSRWSAVWQEAENRLHAQKALMLFLLDS
ncbi:MAG: ornithine carbamoyltransferase [bacterium]